ncbi:hypothetical protein ACHJH3_10840 [Campylobacter sp. MOP7]|uniref:hypothetical protein n=1 Tax=Campylobacter canis TaxID=3378588 RepID=UPI00387E3322
MSFNKIPYQLKSKAVYEQHVARDLEIRKAANKRFKSFADIISTKVNFNGSELVADPEAYAMTEFLKELNGNGNLDMAFNVDHIIVTNCANSDQVVVPIELAYMNDTEFKVFIDSTKMETSSHNKWQEILLQDAQCEGVAETTAQEGSTQTHTTKRTRKSKDVNKEASEPGLEDINSSQPNTEGDSNKESVTAETKSSPAVANNTLFETEQKPYDEQTGEYLKPYTYTASSTASDFYEDDESDDSYYENEQNVVNGY